MELSNAFYEAVEKKQVRKIRIMLEDSLLVDPTFERFKEMERVAASVEGLYDVHDGIAIEENPKLWDDDYMSKIMVQVVSNFSHERVEHLMRVVRKLRPVTEKSSNASARKRTSSDRTGKSDYQAQKQRDQANGNYREAKIVAGAVAGGVVCCAVGAAVASSAGAAVGAVGGAVVGAVAVAAYCSNNERK